MTLFHLHSRFPTCLCLPLGLDVTCVLVPWVRLLSGFPWPICWFWLLGLLSYLGRETISSAWWEWTLYEIPWCLMVVLFTSTIEMHWFNVMAGVPCSAFYLIIFLCTMMDGYTYCILFYSWILKRWCNLFYSYIFFLPFIPSNLYSGWLCILIIAKWHSR